MSREAKLLIVAENLAKAAINDAKGDLGGFEAAAKKVGDTLKTAFTVTAILAAGKEIARFGAECVRDFGGVERSMIQLRAALGGSESSFSRMTDLMDEMAGKTLASKDEVEALVAELASLGKSDADIDKLTRASVALANVTGDTLDGAMKKLLSAQEGQIRGLKVLIPEVGNLTKEQLAAGGAADLLNAKFGAISDAMAGGIAQTFSNTGKSIEDLKEGIGELGAPIFEPAIAWIGRIADKWATSLSNFAAYRRGVKAGLENLELEDQKKSLTYQISDKLAKQGLEMRQLGFSDKDPKGPGTPYATTLERLQVHKELLKLQAELQAVEAKIIENNKLEPLRITEPGTSGNTGTDSKDSNYNPANDPSLYTQSSMEGLGGANDLGKTGGGAAGWIPPLEGDLDRLEKKSFSFSEAWASAVDNISSRFASWQDLAAGVMTSLADGLGNALGSMFEALASGEDAWASFGKTAVEALAGVLKSLGAQLAALAVTHLLTGDLIGAGLATAGSIAAYLAAGAASAWAGSMGGGSSESSSASSSASAPSGGAVYTGAQKITFNFYNQGNVVGSGGLKELAYLLRDILATDERYA